MESVRFWLEGVVLWIEERRRSVAIIAALATTLATMVLLGSTVAAPLLSPHQQAAPGTASVPQVSLQHVSKHRHARRHHRAHRLRGGRPHTGHQRHHGAGPSARSHRHSQGGGGTTRGRGPFAPPAGKILHGVSDTTLYSDFADFSKSVGARPSVLEDFYHWDTPLTTGALRRWHHTHTRGVLSLSTAPGGQPELITPRAIAMGRDDHFLLRLNQSIASSHQVVYIRLFPEMNGYWNPYSAYNQDGTRRDAAHSTASFRKAWQRVAIIVRGGNVRAINHELRRQGMPPILRARPHAPAYHAEGVGRALERPKVAFMWTPMLKGSPDVPGNGPGAYWPGKKFVDWVGTDAYARYASGSWWNALDRFYGRYGRAPFAFGEYSPWNDDHSGGFTKRLFRWAEDHRRVGMMIFYRSVAAQTAYSLDHWPKAQRVIRHELNKHRFAR